MKPGNRLRLSADGRRWWEGWGGAAGELVRATVVRPGVSRGGLRVALKLDPLRCVPRRWHRPSSWSPRYWEPDVYEVLEGGGHGHVCYALDMTREELVRLFPPPRFTVVAVSVLYPDAVRRKAEVMRGEDRP